MPQASHTITDRGRGLFGLTSPALCRPLVISASPISPDAELIRAVATALDLRARLRDAIEEGVLESEEYGERFAEAEAYFAEAMATPALTFGGLIAKATLILQSVDEDELDTASWETRAALSVAADLVRLGGC